MRINKICSIKKNKLVLSIHQQNLAKKSQIDVGWNLIGISNSIEKRCPTIKSIQSKSGIVLKEIRSTSNKENQKHQDGLRLTSASQYHKFPQKSFSKAQLEIFKYLSTYSQTQPTFHSLISDLISILKNQSIISQSHLYYYTIKKDHLHTLISQLMISRSDNNLHKQHKQRKYEGPLFQFLIQKIKEVEDILSYHSQKQKNKIKIISNEINFQYSNLIYRDEVLSNKQQLEGMYNEKVRLQSQIQMLNQRKEIRNKQFILREREIAQQVKTINNNKVELSKIQFQNKQIVKEIQTHQDLLAKTKQKIHQLSNYVNQQNNKLLVEASEDYINIEGEIYDYAAFLQCHQLASDLAYEPLTITCITEDLQNQIKNVNKTLIQNENLSFLDKSRIMRDFLMQWMNRFMRKEEEQKKFRNFKTKCVRTFIQKMKTWLDNWTFKQEYLVNLRNQFAINSCKMMLLLKDLSELSTCDHCGSSITSISAQMSEIYTKIDTNYKLGNSFY